MSDGQEAPEEFPGKENIEFQYFSIQEILSLPKSQRLQIARGIWS